MQIKNSKLVSIIIPCYNAEHWVAEAVQSCLDQTYSPIEIIVVDDGSTDESLGVLQSFGDRIKLESGLNRGGNHARNRGIELSRGDYIQFLDADDYLLPEKIEYQVRFLEETGADVVYGDWRHRYHMPGGSDYLDDVKISGVPNDIIESLLKNDWWVANLAILFRRASVLQSGGWDEILQAGQDRDFFTQVALTDADIQYQPGCCSIYRRYGNVTVSTSDPIRLYKSHILLLKKAEGKLREHGRLDLVYRYALAESYHTLGRNFYRLGDNEGKQCLRKALSLLPAYKLTKYHGFAIMQRIGGFMVADKAAGLVVVLKVGTKSLFEFFRKSDN